MAASYVTAANMVAEVRLSNGLDTNGGMFALTSGSSVSLTDLTIDASNNLKVTSTTAGAFATANQYLYISAGVGWTQGWVFIVSTSAGAAILDMSPSAAGNANLGSATYYNVSIDYSRNNTYAAFENGTGHGASTNTLTPQIGASTGNGWTQVSAADIGNCVQIVSGTNAQAGIYPITAVSAGALGTGTWTLGNANQNAFSGACTNLVYKMGGAFKTLQPLGSGVKFCTNGTRIYVKAEATIALATGWTLTTNDTSGVPTHSNPQTIVQGYTSARNDGGHFTLQASTSGVTLLTTNNLNVIYACITFDGNSQTNSTGISNGSGTNTTSEYHDIICKNCLKCGLHLNNSTNVIVDYCEFYGSSTAGFGYGGNQALSVEHNSTIMNCYIHDCTCAGIIAVPAATSMTYIHNNLVVNCTGVNGVGIYVNSGFFVAMTCNTIDNCGGHCIDIGISDNGGMNVIRSNMISGWGQTTAGTFGINMWSAGGQAAKVLFDGNGFYNTNSTGANRNNMDDVGATNPINGMVPLYTWYTSKDKTVTSNPYVNPQSPATASSDWGLSGNAAGASLATASPFNNLPLGYGGKAGNAAMGCLQPKVGGILIGPPRRNIFPSKNIIQQRPAKIIATTTTTTITVPIAMRPRVRPYPVYVPQKRNTAFRAHAGILVLRTPPKQITRTQTNRRTFPAALLAAPPVLTVLRTPPRTFVQRWNARRVIPAAILAAPPVVIPLRLPPRQITRTQIVRRNAGSALFAQTNVVNQTVLVTSTRKVR